MYSSALLAIIERAGHDTAVLVDGLSEAEFLRSRVTRAERRAGSSASGSGQTSPRR